MYDRIASLLSERGIQFNVQNNTGWTPLMYVCIEGQEAIAKGLRKHPKINVNLYKNDAKTALIHACLSNGERIVKVLLERRDIDVNFNHKGWTALAYACQLGRGNIVKLLLQRHGIDNTITISDGKTPYDIRKGRLSEDVRVILKIPRHPRRTSYLEVR
jgi:ankyrin repeat protein